MYFFVAVAIYESVFSAMCDHSDVTPEDDIRRRDARREGRRNGFASHNSIAGVAAIVVEWHCAWR